MLEPRVGSRMLPTSPGFIGLVPSPVWSNHLTLSTDQYSPSPTQSKPISTWRFATSATTGPIPAATSAPPTPPRARQGLSPRSPKIRAAA
jgi:hypothetical protein